MLAVSDMAMPAQNDNHTAIRYRRLVRSLDVSTPTVASTNSPSTDNGHNAAPIGSEPPTAAYSRWC